MQVETLIRPGHPNLAIDMNEQAETAQRPLALRNRFIAGLNVFKSDLIDSYGHWTGLEGWRRRVHRYPLLIAFIALLLGGVCGHYWEGSRWTCLLASSLLATSVGIVFWRVLGNTKRVLASTLVLTSLFSTGFLYGLQAVPAEGDSLSPYAQRRAGPVVLRAVVVGPPVWRPNPNYVEGREGSPWRTQWQLHVTAIRDKSRWLSVSSKTRLSIEGHSAKLLPGDVVEVFGEMSQIVSPTNPGGFDFAQHSAALGEFVRLSAQGEEQLTVVGFQYWYLPQRVRSLAVVWADNAFAENLSERNASLAAALVFGQREQVDWTQQQSLMATGTLHMLAISGMHVEILVGSLLLACWVLQIRDRWRLVLVLVVCLSYAALAGGKPPVIRATMLLVVYEFSSLFGRKTRITNLLSLAAIVLFMMRFSNVGNVGVHLSFLAVATIGIFVLQADGGEERTPLQRVIYKSLQSWARWLDIAWLALIKALKLSFWVWLMTCPLVWIHFHVVAPIAIILNLLVSLPLAIGLVACLFTVILGGVPILAHLTGQLADWCLNFILGSIHLAEQMPLGHFWLPAPHWSWALCFYLLSGVWLICLREKYRGVLGGLLAAWLLLALLLAVPSNERESWGHQWQANTRSQEASATFLDVGHGTSIVIECPDGSVWLYDAGRMGSPDRSYQGIADALWSMGYARIDTLVISHPDADHYNAAAGLVERFAIGRVASNASFWQSPDREVRELIKLLESRDIETETWHAGMAGTQAGLHWSVLHPMANMKYREDNASSICLMLEMHGQRVCLPGDLEGEGLALMELPDRPCHVIMAPHHGSLAVDPTSLLEWCRPHVVVVSGNHRADRPEVRSRYQMTGAKVLTTFADGAIRFEMSPEGGEMFGWSDCGWEAVASRASTGNQN